LRIVDDLDELIGGVDTSCCTAQSLRWPCAAVNSRYLIDYSRY